MTNASVYLRVLQGNKELLLHAGRMKEDHWETRQRIADQRRGLGHVTRMASRQDQTPRDVRPSPDVKHLEMPKHLGSHGLGQRASTDCNGYKRWTGFIITLVVVNSNSSSLTQIVN
ncbi:hypothetical protein IG631_23371 [Alternaria alternata]|nr:hypothetical protein IG631_23371 [Alternaria alternata]